MRRTTLWITVLAGSALAGCAAPVRTPYVPPAVALPAQFVHAEQEAAVPQEPSWWRAFADPQLDAWIDLALARNSDLAAAAIRVRRAVLEAQLAARALVPTPSLSLAGTATQPLSGDARGLTTNANAQLGLSWELDLFDRLGAQRDAAAWEAQASCEDLDAVALSMVGSVANLYWQIGWANERIGHAQHSLAYAQRIQALVALRYRSGADSRLALREAEQAVAQQQVALSQLVQSRAELRQTLMVLFNGAPPGLEAEPPRLPANALPPVSAGLPAELLGRRPDLRAAELRLRAALASSDAAAARLYPTLSLTGSLGTSSQALLQVLANPVASLGANLSLPFLNARELGLAADIARTRHEEAVLNFGKTLYGALAEVDKALSARAQQMQQLDWLRLALEESQQIERLYAMRYRAGQAPLREWLDAQERLRSSELAHGSARLALLQSYLALQQALGGGVDGVAGVLSAAP